MKVNKTKKRKKNNKFRRLKTRRRNKTNQFRRLKTRRRNKTNQFRRLKTRRRNKTNQFRRKLIENNKQQIGGNPLSCVGNCSSVDEKSRRARGRNILDLNYDIGDVVGHFVLSAKSVNRLHRIVPHGVYHQVVVCMECTGISDVNEFINVRLHVYSGESFSGEQMGFLKSLFKDQGILQISKYIIIDNNKIKNKEIFSELENKSIVKLVNKNFLCNGEYGNHTNVNDYGYPLDLSKIYTINKSDPVTSIQNIVNDFENSDAVSQELICETTINPSEAHLGGGPTVEPAAPDNPIDDPIDDPLGLMDSLGLTEQAEQAEKPQINPDDLAKLGVWLGNGEGRLEDLQQSHIDNTITLVSDLDSDIFHAYAGEGAEISRLSTNNQDKLFFINYQGLGERMSTSDVDNLVMGQDQNECCINNNGMYHLISNNCRDFVNCMLSLLREAVRDKNATLKIIRVR
jgi:hypothetical protein